MADLLRMDHINGLPHPFLARFCGDKTWWPVNDFEVGTGLMRIDVCGLLQVKSFGEVMELQDGEGHLHDPDTFYTDYEADACPVCAQPMAWAHDHKPDQSGLDDGPYLPGQAPRKKTTPKLPEEITEIRNRAWATRRAKYGQKGHR